MKNPDYRAFEQYISLGMDRDTAYLSVPRAEDFRTKETPSSHYMLVNVEGAVKDPNGERLTADALKRHFQRAALTEAEVKALMEISASPALWMKGDKNISIEKFLESSKEHASMVIGGGGAAAPKASLFMMDGRTINDVMKYATPHMVQTDRDHIVKLTAHHEAAHLMLGLEEAGSDFIGAAMLLRESPDARGALRQWADMRLLNGFHSGGGGADLYGSECHDAIEHAMSIPPERLKTMSIEELHAIGKQYDDLNTRNNKMEHSAEDNVRDSMLDLDIGRGLSFIWSRLKEFDLPSMDAVTDNFKQQNLSPDDIAGKIGDLNFAKGTPERAVADNVSEAIHRMKPQGYRPIGT